MKKGIVMLLTAFLMLGMTACGTQGNVNQDTETETETETDNSAQNEETLSKIDEANADFDSILTEYGSVLFTYDYAQEDKEDSIYATPDTYLEIDNNGYVFIDDGDATYGRYSEAEDDYFKMISFNEEDHEAMVNIYEAIPWYTSDLLDLSAEITTDEDNIAVTLTQEITDEDKEAFEETYDIDAEDIQNVEYRLEVDSETMLINRITYSVTCDSTGIIIEDISAQYGAEQPEVPEGFDAFLNETDVRNITFVINPGSDNEETFEDTIRKGCAYELIADSFECYTDEAFTEAYEGTEDLTQDTTIYMKSIQ